MDFKNLLWEIEDNILTITINRADNDKFYSYRYEKGKTGRMLALIGMK